MFIHRLKQIVTSFEQFPLHRFKKIPLHRLKHFFLHRLKDFGYIVKKNRYIVQKKCNKHNNLITSFKTFSLHR